MVHLPKRSGHRGTARGAGGSRRTACPDLSDPVIACLGPAREVWEVSGYGTVYVARQRPDGLVSLVSATLSLPEGGLTLLAGRPDAPQDTHLWFVSELGRVSDHPASRPLPPDIVADYLYGACAMHYADEPFDRWPNKARRALAILERPLGDAVAWRNRLTGPGGLTPAGLMHALGKHPDRTELPEDRDPAVHTTAEAALGLGAGEEAVQRLLARTEPPLFHRVPGPKGETVLQWRRPHPPGQGTPVGGGAAVFEEPGRDDQWTLRLRAEDGQQIMGEIRIAGDEASIASLTFSSAAILMSALSAAAGSPPKVRSAQWRDVRYEDFD